MAKPVRFAIMGAGFIARPNGEGLLSHPLTRLVAISNRTVEKAKELAQDLNVTCAIYQDWQEMLEKESLDAVLINLPHFMHPQVFTVCAQKGLDVIIEKPLANTFRECQEMIAVAEQYKVKATVCHTQRYHGVLQDAADFIASHDLGQLLSISDHIHTHYFWDGRSDWQLSNELSGGGIVLNYGVHQLDRVHYFLKQKTKTFAAQYLFKKEGFVIPSSYAMMGIGDEGVPYTINCSGYTGPHIDEMRLIFSKGILHCCIKGSGLYPAGLYFGDTKSGEFESVPAGYDPQKNYEREMLAAVDYLAGITREAPVSLEWAAEMVRLVEQGWSNE